MARTSDPATPTFAGVPGGALTHRHVVTAGHAAFGVALALHAGLFGLNAVPLPPAAERVVEERAALDVDIDPGVRDEAEPPSAGSRETSEGPLPRWTHASRAPRGGLAFEGEARPAPTASASAKATDQWTPLPARRWKPGPRSGLPGLGGPDVWTYIAAAPPPDPAPTVVPPALVDRGIADRVLGSAVDAKAKANGLDLPAAGTVGRILADAVRSMGTIDDVRATFEVTLGPGGKVLGVRVTSVSAGSRADWDRIVAAAKAALATQVLVLGARYERGAIVHVEVESTLALPSGGKSSAGFFGAGFYFDPSNWVGTPKRIVRPSHRVTALR